MINNKYVDISSPKNSYGSVYYERDYDIDAINNSIMNLFSIELGEVPGKPWLGNPLSFYLFDNIGYFEQRSIEISIRNTLSLYEPRVEIDYVYVKMEDDTNSMEINIGYYTLLGSQEVFEDLKFKYSHNNMTSIAQRI